MRQADRLLDEISLQPAAAHHEVHVDLREHLGVGVGALGAVLLAVPHKITRSWLGPAVEGDPVKFLEKKLELRNEDLKRAKEKWQGVAVGPILEIERALDGNARRVLILHRLFLITGGDFRFDAAADRKVAHHGHAAGLTGGDEVVEDLIGDIFVKDALVAEFH